MDIEQIKRRRLKLNDEFNENALKKHKLNSQADATLENMSVIARESERVADLALNARRMLDDLDREFERRTALNALDQKFLWLTVALQCARQYILTNDAFRLTSVEGDRMVSSITPKQWQDVLLAPVPYDAIRKMNPDVNTGLSGYTHRYRTLGHDPVLGWVFGPMNILSDSLTKSDFSSYAVRNMTICDSMSTPDVFAIGMEQTHANKYNLPTAVVRQAIHFGSDYFTTQGLPMPFVCSVNNDIAKTLITRFNIDMYSVTRGAAVAALINGLISFIHQLFYDESRHGSRKLYEVKTRKILMYSNLISSASNVLYVAFNGCVGNMKALKAFDVGGLMVTLYRIVSDIGFMGAIKREFISESFNEMIRGEEYNF